MGTLDEWIKSKETIGLDTMVFIYYFENNARYAAVIEPVLKAIESGKLRAVTSTITLTEIMTKPYEQGDPQAASEYLAQLEGFPNLEIIPVTTRAATTAAVLRGNTGMKTPDALQVASCLAGGATVFLSHDSALAKNLGKFTALPIVPATLGML